jgi:hypothetical protein
MSELVAKPIAVAQLVGFARALPTLRNRLVMIRIKETLNQFSDFEVRIISAPSPPLILRSIAQAMRLEGWPQTTTVQAAILRDASRRPKGEGLLLRMRSESLETIGFMESIV